jgi:eukaryotic-like serine/threonine-protein kinase
MSPEQAEGKPVDARADVFAAGAVLYEMLTGRRPFTGDTQVGQLLAVMRDAPPPLRATRAETPPELERIVLRCLEKEPVRRYPSAVELHAELAQLQAAQFASRAGRPSLLRRPAIAIPVTLALVAAVAAAGWLAWGARQRTQARARLAELETLVSRHELVKAWLLVEELRPILGEDRELERQRLAISRTVTIRTEPPGAELSIRGYLDDPAVWHPLGVSPIERLRLPATSLVFRAQKPGFEEAQGAPYLGLLDDAHTLAFALVPAGSAPEGMVRIPAGRGGYDGPELELGAFWLGRHEVTNREFRRFVEAGGYRDRALWSEPIVDDGGRPLSWDEAMARFVDATGRPGPSTWRFGAPLEGQEEHPVAGLSWYEADAYARWTGGALPTLHHWFRAADQDTFSEILQRGNFSGRGTVPVGTNAALGPFGAHDMAGNVFEWTSTADGIGQLYCAGGAWNEPSYTYGQPGAVSPLDRGPNRGLRLARYDGPVPDAARAAVLERENDPSEWVPVDDAAFAVYRGLYTRATGALAAAVDAIDDVSPNYRWERVSFDAGRGGERMPANLLLPKNARPPYQVVLYFPSSAAEALSSSRTLDELPWFDFLVRGGRALLFPVYTNTYERRIPDWKWSPEARRDVLLEWSREIARAIDYLETRPDIDPERIAFYGFSMGAIYGPVLSAVEPRIRVNLFLGGGVHPSAYRPEINPVNFAPRVTIPTLMLTGKDDFVRPIATRQEPLLRLLGTPDDQKKLAAFDGGHVPSDMTSVAREALAWLDRWLGPWRRDTRQARRGDD